MLSDCLRSKNSCFGREWFRAWTLFGHFWALLLARQRLFTSMCLSFHICKMGAVTVPPTVNIINILRRFLAKRASSEHHQRPTAAAFSHLWWPGWARRHRQCCWDIPVWWSRPQAVESSGNVPSRCSWGWGHWESESAHLWEEGWGSGDHRGESGVRLG